MFLEKIKELFYLKVTEIILPIIIPPNKNVHTLCLNEFTYTIQHRLKTKFVLRHCVQCK